MQDFSSSLQCFKVMSSPHSAECLHFLHPICSNRGCLGALCTVKDQVCHLFWCLQKEKKITTESLQKPLVFNDPSVSFHCVLLERHLIYFKRSQVFSEPSLHISCDISSIPSKTDFLTWQATEQCSFFFFAPLSLKEYKSSSEESISRYIKKMVCLVMCIIQVGNMNFNKNDPF